MRFVRAALAFVVWLVLGWLWLMLVALVVGGVVALTIQYFFMSGAAPAYAAYLISGLTLFVAGLLALFSSARSARLGRAVLIWAVVIGVLDTATALLIRFGVDVPRLGYLLVLSDASAGIGSQLVNGVALLAATGVFMFVRSLNAAEKRDVEVADDGETTEQTAADTDADADAETGAADTGVGAEAETDADDASDDEADAGAEADREA